MKEVALLDCTLRDGAYLVDKTFGLPVILGIIEGLEKAHIDIIEIGFLENTDYQAGKTVYRNAGQAEEILRDKQQGCLYTVLADYSRYSIENLDAYTGKSFDAVRACFFKKERKNVLPFCRRIKELGYRLFVQPVDIMGYTDKELLDLLHDVNSLEPNCFSIVDTFGSMYTDDLLRLYHIVHHNLDKRCMLGFHSHNNLQMSSALSQELVRISHGQREVVIDSTIEGLGRGAGNTPTELIAQYMVTKFGYPYDIDAILDTIDRYIPHIRTKCVWGYSPANFIAGSFGAHVNNIAYLRKKNSIDSKAMRHILDRIGTETRKRYDYEKIDAAYMAYMESNIDDQAAMEELAMLLSERNILLIAPGVSAGNTAQIAALIAQKQPLTLSINHIPSNVLCDFLYLNNVKRYNILRHLPGFQDVKKIVTSNIGDRDKNALIVNFSRLVKCGWDHLDNSVIMLLRLLDLFPIRGIYIAGMDGYEVTGNNYGQADMDIPFEGDLQRVNSEIGEMLADYMKNRRNTCPVSFVTASRFQKYIENV